MAHLQTLAQTTEGRVRIVEGAEVSCLTVTTGSGGGGWTAALTNGEEGLDVERILLATGVEVDVRRDPLLAPFVEGVAMTTAASERR